MILSFALSFKQQYYLQAAAQESAGSVAKLQDLQENLDKADQECTKWRSECLSLRQSSEQLQKQLLERTETLSATQSELEQLQLEVQTLLPPMLPSVPCLNVVSHTHSNMLEYRRLLPGQTPRCRSKCC